MVCIVVVVRWSIAIRSVAIRLGDEFGTMVNGLLTSVGSYVVYSVWRSKNKGMRGRIVVL